MNKKLLVLICVIAALACAAQQFSFQSHYIQLGTDDTSVAIAADAAGNIFIVSAIGSLSNLSTRVTKTDPNGKVVAVKNFGESGQNVAPYGVAIDPQGNVFVVCRGLVAKLDNGLAGILATWTTGGTAITIDASGNVWVAGNAGADFPTTPGAYESNPSAGAGYAFVAKLSPDLGKVMYATLYGSAIADCNPIYDACRSPHGPGLFAGTTPTAIAIDPSGGVVIAGYTSGTPAKLGMAPYNYAFAAKFSSNLTSLLGEAKFNPGPDLETYFLAMALDSHGDVLLVGNDGGVSIPGGTLQPDAPSEGGGVVLKFDNSLQNLLWGTYFGGSHFLSVGLNADGVKGVFVDSQDSVWITGLSAEDYLPNSTSTSFADLPYIAELSSDGSSIRNLVSSQFGGQAITATPDGGLAVLGTTDSFLMTAPPDQPALLMVANSASNQSSGTISPVELISLFGTAIGPASPTGGVVLNGAFTTWLGGFQVLFNGVPAPLLYAGPNQINVVSPSAIANQQSVDIEVVGPAGTTRFPTVFVGSARPNIFSELRRFTIPYTLGATQPFVFAIANNQDGTLNSEVNPAHAGSIVTIWATGLGLRGAPSPDGAIVEGAADVNLPIVTYAGQVLYAGQAPGAVQGLTQINIQLPSTGFFVGPPVKWPIGLQIDGSSAGSVFVAVGMN